MNAHNGHQLPAICGHALIGRQVDEDDPWNDPEFARDRPAKGRKARGLRKGRNSITVSVDLSVPLSGTCRETEMHMSLNARNTKALLKNPYLVQQFLESSLRTYRSSGPVRPTR